MPLHVPKEQQQRRRQAAEARLAAAGVQPAQQQQQQPAIQAPAPAWAGLDPAGKVLNEPDGRSVWVSAQAARGGGDNQGEDGGAIDFAALCCSGEPLPTVRVAGRW